MWNASTPTQNIFFATIFWTETNEKCIQTKVNERQRAKRDLLLPIVNQIHTLAKIWRIWFKDLKKPLWNVPTQWLGRTLCYAWFKWSTCRQDETLTRKVWLCCGILLCLESEQRITKRQKKSLDFKKQSYKKLQSKSSRPATFSMSNPIISVCIVFISGSNLSLSTRVGVNKVDFVSVQSDNVLASQPASMAVHLDDLMGQLPSTEQNQKHRVGRNAPLAGWGHSQIGLVEILMLLLTWLASETSLRGTPTTGQ